MKTKGLPTSEELHKYFYYEPSLGTLVAKVSRGKISVGQTVGWKGSNGYTYVGFKGKKYLAHRLIIKIATGECPEGDVDHINRVRSDNRLENLRVVCRSVNLLNTEAKGYYETRYGFVSEFRNKYIGTFNCPTAAHFAYLKTKRGYLNAVT